MATKGQLTWQFLKTNPFFWIGSIFLLDGLVFLAVSGILFVQAPDNSLLRNLFCLLGGIQATLSLIFLGIAWRREARAHLLVDGTPTLGIVAEVVEATNVRINGRHPFYLKYTFVDDFGQKHEGSSHYLPRDKSNQWSAGDHVLVLVDRDQPSQHVADVTDARLEDCADLLKRWEAGRA